MSVKTATIIFPLTMSIACAMTLSACESNGTARFGSVGGGPASSTGGDGTGSSSGSSGGASTSTGGASTSSGASSTSTGGTASVGDPGLIGKLVVISGNVALGAASKHNALAGQIGAIAPGTAPITGKVTRILDKTGQGLVDIGNGRTLLVDGLKSKLGETVTLAVGSATLPGQAGTAPLIGVNLLTKTPMAGQLATVGVLAGSDLALLDVSKPGGTTNLVGDVVGGIAGQTGGAGVVGTVVGTVTGVLVPKASGGTGTVVAPVTGTLGNLGGLLGNKGQ